MCRDIIKLNNHHFRTINVISFNDIVLFTKKKFDIEKNDHHDDIKKSKWMKNIKNDKTMIKKIIYVQVNVISVNELQIFSNFHLNYSIKHNAYKNYVNFYVDIYKLMKIIIIFW